MMRQRWPELIAACVMLTLWGVCLTHTAPGIEARLQSEAELTLRRLPAAGVEMDGRHAIVSGVTGGDYALAARRLLGIRGVAAVRPAS